MVASDIDILREMIKESATEALIDNYGKKKVILVEQDISSVTISGMPEDSIVIKADDSFKSPDSVFRCSKLKGQCKRADYVIVADMDKKKVILYIELKRTKDGEKSIIQQLMGARCFIAYCQEIGRSFWEKQDFLDGYVYRFVSIGHTGIAKRKTRIERKSKNIIHDQPELMMKIAWPSHLHFNHLVGK